MRVSFKPCSAPLAVFCTPSKIYPQAATASIGKAMAITALLSGLLMYSYKPITFSNFNHKAIAVIAIKNPLNPRLKYPACFAA